MADLNPKELDELRQLYKDLQNISIPNMDSFVKAMGGMDAARKNLQQMRQEFSNINSDVSYFAESLTRVLLELKGQNNALSLTKKAYSGISSIVNKLKYDQDDISRLNKKDLENIGKKLIIERQNLEQARKLNVESLTDTKNKLKNKELSEAQRKILKNQKQDLETAIKESSSFLKDGENGINAIIAANSKRLEQEIRITETLGITGKLVDSIVGALGKLGIESSFFENLKEDMRELTKDLR